MACDSPRASSLGSSQHLPPFTPAPRVLLLLSREYFVQPLLCGPHLLNGREILLHVFRNYDGGSLFEVIFEVGVVFHVLARFFFSLFEGVDEMGIVTYSDSKKKKTKRMW